ncbi:flagellar hook-associated protein FlgL [Alicyclobacillus macrosporangiidus]|uniref:flagellar hook-associated protein FlgL n=1 Tax=Alicyclobacillus macrosporangiidus TaxID=392015 RepID=UPI00049783A8|nr:flagellar hook-associated protein FlgL [Alicyclobacillus macrosporangiidus]
MRVTTFGMNAQYLSDLDQIVSKYQDLSQQLSTGRKLNQPSDDPVAMAADIQTQTVQAQVSQWSSNAGAALSQMQTADAALSTLENILGQVRTEVVQALNGTNTAQDLNQICAVVQQQTAAVANVANTSDGGQYIFAGTNGTQAPWDTSSATWKGNSNQRTVVIGGSVTVAVNVDGESLFATAPSGASKGLLATGGAGAPPNSGVLQQIQADLANGDMNGLRTDLSDLDANINQVIAMRSDLGGRMTLVQAAQTQLSQASNLLQQQKGKLEDADLAQVISQLTTQQTVYMAALATGQHLILPTLADVLSNTH